MLEMGRAVMWSQVSTLRSTPIGDLAQAEPSTYNRLSQIRALLDSRVQGAEDAEERTRLAREFESLLEEHGLLRPPSFADLTAAADAGPVVVVNFSRYRCDAVIVAARDEITVVELDAGCHDTLGTWLARIDAARPGPGVAETINANRVLAAALEWLWDAVAAPVLATLGEIMPRLWWCPIGRLASLPLHAAGYHAAGDGRTVLDKTVSSYTPSLAALVAARTRPPGGTPGRLVIALPQTPGWASLSFVQNEIAALPFAHHLLTGPEATVRSVADLLPAHPWVHFACHGQQGDSDPLNNGIVLHDGVLTPWRLAELPLRHGELAYLSACDTAAVDADVADEVIHPAAVLHLTGFRHVIASLGPVHDTHAPTIARDVYTALLDSAEPSLALHNAVNRLRRSYPKMPTIWSRYVHFGP
jgi:hypothetical protein